jgi:SAM-dependent methyltransferase
MDYKDYEKLNAAKNTNFWYEARKVLIFNLLNSLYHQEKLDKNILDIGCGTGTELTVLKKFGKITGLDSSLDALKILQRNGYDALCGDIEKVNLQTNFYDCICCFDVLEHLPNDELALKKIYASLCKDGHFIFTVPAFQFLFSPHDQALGHYRRYSKQKIKGMLRDNGFKIVTINYWNFFLFPAVLLIRLVKKFVYRLKQNNTYCTDLENFNGIINKILFSVLNAENFLCKHNVKFPFGLSIYGIAKK